jgi:hypothetical protein
MDLSFTRNSDQRSGSDEEGDGLLDVDRRSVMKAAGASAGALLGGSTVTGSVAGQTGDRNCFQVDLVDDSGDGVRDPLSDSNKYSDDGRLIAWQWGNWEDDSVDTGESGRRGASYDHGCDVTITSPISFDYNADEATVEVDVNDCGSGSSADFALVSYKAPCGNPNDPVWTGSQQAVFASTRETVSESDGPTTLTVDIPGDSPGVPQENSLQAYYPLNTVDGTNYLNAANVAKQSSPTANVPGVSPATGDAYQFTNNVDTDTPGDAIFSSNFLDVNGSSGTVAAWFQYTGTLFGKEEFGRVLQAGGTLDEPPTNGYDIEFSGTDDELQLVLFSDGSTSTTSTLPVSTDTFYFVVAVVGDSNGEARLHVFSKDGGELSNSPVTVSGNRGTGDKILHMMGGDGRDVAGTMDEVFGYNTALTSAEVTKLRYDSTDEAPVTNTTQGSDHDTIQAAIDAASSGDTINVKSGTHSEDVTFNSGTTGLTLQSTGDYTNTTISASGGISVNADNTTIDGFTLEKTTDDGTGLVYVSGSGSTISNCLADGNGNISGGDTGSGVIELQTDATVQSNVVQNSDVGAVGVKLVGSSNGSTVRDNIIRNIGSDSGGNAVRGTDFSDNPVQLDNSSVTGNDITDNNFGVFAADPDSPDTDTNALDATNNFFNNNQFGKAGGDVNISPEASSPVASGPDGFTG